MLTTHQVQYTQKSPMSINRDAAKVEQSRTSIQIGDGNNYPLMTSTQIQYTAHPNVAQKLDKDLVKNLRAAHFDFGQHPPTYESANKGYGGF